MPGIGVISNPKSKQNRKDPEKMRRLAYLVGTGGDAAETSTLEELYEVAERFKRERIDILAINGGDGSLHITVDAFIKVYNGTPLPKLAILRGGTMNTVATGLGIKGNPSSILYRTVETYDSKEPFVTRKVNTLCVDGKYGFIFGNGAIYNFLAAYYETGNPSPSTGAKLLAQSVGSILVGGQLSQKLLGHIRAEVVADGVLWEQTSFLTIGASCVPEVGLGFTPFYRCKEEISGFHVVGIYCTPKQIAAELPRIYQGKPIRPEYAIEQEAKKLEIRSSEGLGYTIDGDCYVSPPTLVIEVGPAFEVIIS